MGWEVGEGRHESGRAGDSRDCVWRMPVVVPLTFHEQAVIRTSGRDMDSPGDLIEDLKVLSRKIYAHTLTHKHFQTTLERSWAPLPQSSSRLRTCVPRGESVCGHPHPHPHSCIGLRGLCQSAPGGCCYSWGCLASVSRDQFNRPGTLSSFTTLWVMLTRAVHDHSLRKGHH